MYDSVYGYQQFLICCIPNKKTLLDIDSFQKVFCGKQEENMSFQPTK